jgi:MoaA/NifB/PqqE/SkfB family radical SAM enzyme
MKSIQSRWNHQSTIKIEWNLGKRCNLDCAYCPEYIHDNHSPHINIDILKSTVDKLSSLKKSVRISLTGGEPSVHPYIAELARYIKEKDIKWLSMTTNATRKPDWYLRHEEYFDQYVFSLHFEKDIDRLLSTILEVNKKRIKKILVHVMAHHKYMNQVKDAVQKLDFFNVPYVIRRIRWTEGNHDLFDDTKYHTDDLKWIKDNTATAEPNCIVDDSLEYHANDIIKLHMNQFNGWKCNIGIESLMINWDGEVHRATCRVGGSLGNIYNGTFIVPEEPITCTRHWCTCEADIPITKLDAIIPENNP